VYLEAVPFLDPKVMLHGRPLPGWSGRFFHSENNTFALWDIAADAAPLHEHHHPEEEVWNVVEGELLLTIDGDERPLGPGSGAIVPPGTPHSARVTTACRAVVVDHPVRRHLPGVPTPADG
jgi:mannose-6-phosphate isomerase-like protein (cupin superfamily)